MAKGGETPTRAAVGTVGDVVLGRAADGVAAGGQRAVGAGYGYRRGCFRRRLGKNRGGG